MSYACVGLIEQEELKLILRESWQEEETRHAQEPKSLMAIGPSRLSTAAEEITMPDEGGQTKPHTST